MRTTPQARDRNWREPGAEVDIRWDREDGSPAVETGGSPLQPEDTVGERRDRESATMRYQRRASACADESGIALTTDQRGAPRVAGPRCDVGAFESGAAVDRIFHNGFE